MSDHLPIAKDLIFAAVKAAQKAARGKTESVGANIDERVGACLFAPDDPPDILTGYANVISPALEPHFDKTQRMGNASIYIHSEVASIYASDRPVEGMALVVTTPPCPNCAKVIAESGITHVFQDRDGFRGDFAAARKSELKQMSLEIFRRAGVQFHLVNTQRGLIRPPARQGPVLPPVKPENVQLLDIDEGQKLYDFIPPIQERYQDQAYATARVTAPDGTTRALVVLESLPPGITPEYYKKIQPREGKYRFPLDPMNRLIIHCKRMGYSLERAHILCSLHPAPRAFVNASAFGVKKVSILNPQTDHGTEGPEAAQLLRDHNIMQIITTAPTDSPKRLDLSGLTLPPRAR